MDDNNHILTMNPKYNKLFCVVICMIKDLFINSTIIISAIFMLGNIYRENTLSKSSPLITRVCSGMLGGLIGVVLMFFSIKITNTMITDFRHLPILILSLQAGFIPSVVSAVIIALFRVIYFGLSKASVLAAISMIIIGVGVNIFNRLRISKLLKWTFMNIFSIVTITYVFYILLEGKEELFNVLINYWVIGIVTTILVYYLNEYVEQSNKAYRKYKEEATIDFLTGLNNVRKFDIIYNELIKSVINNDQKLSFLMIDIDHFKRINDTYGHDIGDIVLSQLSSVLKNNVRQIDFVSRMGGEEFSILLPNCCYIEALDIAEKVRKSVEENGFIISNNKALTITVSIGVATLNDAVNEKEKLIKDADTGLYIAKRSGRNKVSSVYTENYSFVAATKE